MRKLATIRRIDEINPIPNADAIEVATVGGWKVVVKKGQFALNEFALFLEIDSWVPQEIAPFLCKGKEPREYMGVKGERLKTVRLRGQLSQGLLIPLKEVWAKLVDTTVNMHPVDWDSFISIVNDKWNAFEGFRDVDYSEQLGILKWEPQIPAQLAGLMKGNFPSFIQKTDQERIQNLTRQIQDILTDNADELFEVTEKLDGSSMTVYWRDKEFGVCSRNIDLKESDDNAYWKMAKSLNLKEKLEDYGRNIALQGELIGAIHGNPYGVYSNEFKIFNIYNIDESENLLPLEREDVLFELGLHTSTVPFCGVHKLSSIGSNIAEILLYAEGDSALNGSEREGLVFKSYTRNFSFKVVSNRWLLGDRE